MPKAIKISARVASGSRKHGIMLGVWLAGLFAASLIGRQQSSDTFWLFSLAAALSWPLVYFLLPGKIEIVSYDTPLRKVLIAGIGIFSAISVLVSPAIYVSLGYWILTLIGFYIAIQFLKRLDSQAFTAGLRLYVILMIPLVLWLAWHDYRPGVRLGQYNGILNPNSLSLVAVSMAVAACVIANLPLRLLAIAPGVIVIWMTGSRASAIAVIVAWAIVFLVMQQGKSWVRKLFVTSMVALLVVVVGAAVPELPKQMDRFFAVNDAQRGLNSGATGRVQTWAETLNLAFDHPLTGVGFRAHEGFLKTNTSAHNGYLATLAEIGFLGFGCVIALVVTGIVNLMRVQPDLMWRRVQAVLLGLAVGYLALAMFARYLINIGNPTSLLFLLAILFPRFHVDATAKYGLSAEAQDITPPFRAVGIYRDVISARRV
jgi:O-antigen ligase